MTPEEEIRRANEAERLLADPLLSAAFSDVESAILTELRAVDVGARDKQRDLIVTLQLLGNLRRILRTHIETGKLARLAKESMRDRLRKIAS